MLSFKDFFRILNGRSSASSLLPTEKSVASLLSKQFSSSGISISSKNATEAAEKLAEIAVSDSTISEFSNAIGVPKENETEDEFVLRARTALEKILMKKFSGE